MEPLFASSSEAGRMLVHLIIWTVALTVGGGFLGWVFGIFRRPLRERHDAEFLLGLIEHAHRRGGGVERDLVSLAAQRDVSLDPRFFLLADEIERGRPLADALDRVNDLVPRELQVMLQHGLRHNVLPQVLPVCRQRLRDADARVQSAMRAIAGGGIGILLFMLPTFFLLRHFVVPKLQEIAYDMLEDSPVTLLGIWESGWLDWGVAAIFLTMLAALYVFTGFVPFRFPGRDPAETVGLTGWLDWRLPWRRMRLERDFSGLLAAQLDAGLPEETALRSAAGAVGNRHLLRAVEQSIARLQRGEPITDALARLDRSREFAWRWRNAARAGGGFTAALRGWQESLEARAFFREQAAAQLLMTGMILANGLLIALIGAGFFQMFNLLIDAAAPW